MKIVKLVCRDRRSLEYCESRVGEYSLPSLSSSPVFACHIAIVGGGISPGESVAFIVRAHTVEPVASRQLSFEVKDIGQFNVWRRALVVIAVLIEPRNGIRAWSAIGRCMILRDRRSAGFRRGLRVKLTARQRSRNHGSDAKLQQIAPVQGRTALVVVPIDQRMPGRIRIKSELHGSSLTETIKTAAKTKWPCLFRGPRFAPSGLSTRPRASRLQPETCRLS